MAQAPEAGSGIDKQTCGTCNGMNVQPVTRTIFVVYLRCSDCGASWAIPERRKNIRSDDLRRF
jgi:hypothetical protein